MGLPLYLALTAAEMRSVQPVPQLFAYMACHFSPYTQGITNLPSTLPEGSMLILNDRMPCQAHSANLVAQQLCDAVSNLHCESVLLDFQQPPDSQSEAMVQAIVSALPCPVAVSAAHGRKLTCPVFLPPCPPHLPMAEYLAPWQTREIWLEAALCQEEAIVTPNGTEFITVFPTRIPDSGFFDDTLCCQYSIRVQKSQITFSLYETPQTLRRKLDQADSLGVTRAVGLYQELGQIKPPV